MPADVWSRPTLSDLHEVLESIEKDPPAADQRAVPRLELCVPAEVKTLRGNTVPAMTREISRGGLGLLTSGRLNVGYCRVKMSSETREFDYRVEIEWCRPTETGLWLSGGRFVTDVLPDAGA
ncbi:PilZ domain-containing protein [Alienimonas sp. DA493]|uniref:PilZ domain-containing protein n=1 Tax=Alienimonas sp. DA493 TaxID=3373605 RepID=UPI003754C8F8